MLEVCGFKVGLDKAPAADFGGFHFQFEVTETNCDNYDAISTLTPSKLETINQ
jgi:hypothetical protein